MSALRHFALSALLVVSAVAAARADGLTLLLDSPTDQLRLTVNVTALSKTDDGKPTGGEMSYRMDRRYQDPMSPAASKDAPHYPGLTVLRNSPLGITRDDQQFTEGLEVVSTSQVEKVDEEYTLIHGKQRQCRVVANRQTITLQNPEGARVELQLHVADDGAAFRYRFPDKSDELHTVASEATSFQLPEGSRAWIQPYQNSTKWTPSYEDYYLNDVPAGTTSPTEAGWCLPALFKIPRGGNWVLLAEAAVDGTYCGTRLASEAPEGLYQIRFPDAKEGNGAGAVEPSSTLPWTTPWRVVVVGGSLDEVVRSTMVTDLCPPCAVEDTDWIKPGRVAWSWWSDHDSPRDYQKQIEFIDLAAEMGWEYYLVDANWTLMDGGDVRQMAEYAQSKGVGLFLWYNSGGEHNFVTEKPRGCLLHPKVRDFEFGLLKEWGIKGIKVDFFQSDKQNMMDYYLGILEDAARHELMINYHGCTAPRGWSRTWPNLMSMESVKGAECYSFAKDYPQKAPWHNTILPFTRNVIGPMDYTPCTFSDDKYPHITTSAHELALSIVFESGLLHLADCVAAYRDLPAGPRQFLRDVPVVWDETRVVGGEPGRLAVIARRRGDDWYLGGISGENATRNVSLDFGFLGDGQYDLALIGDGEDARTFAELSKAVQSDSPVLVTLLPFGGFAAKLTPK